MAPLSLDGNFLSIAERKIKAALVARQQTFGYRVADLHTRAVKAGSLHGSAHQQIVRDACRTELRERFQAAWQMLRSIAIEFRLSRSADIANALKAEAKSLVIESMPDLRQAISLTRDRSEEDRIQSDLSGLVQEVLPEVEADIDLFVSAPVPLMDLPSRAAPYVAAGQGSAGLPATFRPPMPVGSPYGFQDEDWALAARRKSETEKLYAILGFQFASEHYDTERLKANVKTMLDRAMADYNARRNNSPVALEYRPLAAGYGEHLFNQIARDIIGADVAIFDTSDLNPNVMLEMGVALTWGIPVLPIKADGCAKPPSDVSGQTWVDYRHSAAEFLDPDHHWKVVSMIGRALQKKTRLTQTPGGANAQPTSQDSVAHRTMLQSDIRLLGDILESLPDSSTMARADTVMRSARSFNDFDFRGFRALAAEVDEEAARAAEKVESKMTWMAERETEVKSTPTARGYDWGKFPWREWNDAKRIARESLTAILAELDHNHL